MNKKGAFSEKDKKEKSYVSGIVCAWLMVPVQILPLILSYSEKKPDEDSWRSFAFIALFGICMIAFSIALLHLAAKCHYSAIGQLVLIGALAVHIIIAILGITGSVWRASFQRGQKDLLAFKQTFESFQNREGIVLASKDRIYIDGTLSDPLEYKGNTAIVMELGEDGAYAYSRTDGSNDVDLLYISWTI